MEAGAGRGYRTERVVSGAQRTNYLAFGRASVPIQMSPSVAVSV